MNEAISYVYVWRTLQHAVREISKSYRVSTYCDTTPTLFLTPCRLLSFRPPCIHPPAPQNSSTRLKFQLSGYFAGRGSRYIIMAPPRLFSTRCTGLHCFLPPPHDLALLSARCHFFTLPHTYPSSSSTKDIDEDVPGRGRRRL